MSKKWTPQEAFCAFATIAIEIDGTVGAEEQDALMKYLGRSQVLAEHSDDLNDLIKTVHTHVSKHGEYGTLASAGASLPDHLKEAAFKAACDLTWSDDGTDKHEMSFLHEAAKSLAIPPERRDALMDAASPN